MVPRFHHTLSVVKLRELSLVIGLLSEPRCNLFSRSQEPCHLEPNWARLCTIVSQNLFGGSEIKQNFKGAEPCFGWRLFRFCLCLAEKRNQIPFLCFSAMSG